MLKRERIKRPAEIHRFIYFLVFCSGIWHIYNKMSWFLVYLFWFCPLPGSVCDSTETLKNLIFLKFKGSRLKIFIIKIQIHFLRKSSYLTKPSWRSCSHDREGDTTLYHKFSLQENIYLTVLNTTSYLANFWVTFKHLN